MYTLFWSPHHKAGSIIDYARALSPWEFEMDHESRLKAHPDMTFNFSMALRFGFQKRDAPKDDNEDPVWQIDSEV
jgi:hypothetical protein